MLKKHNALFVLTLGVSVILMALIMAGNISDKYPGMRKLSPKEEAQLTTSVREKLLRLGLPLHEGKYWKAIDE